MKKRSSSRKLIITVISLLVFPLFSFNTSHNIGITSTFADGDKDGQTISISETLLFDLQIEQMYHEFELDDKLNFAAFKTAFVGYYNFKAKDLLENDRFLAIADFSVSSSEKRLFIIDLVDKTVFLETYVAHGKNSGSEYARYFSNSPNTRKSSIGFYITGMPYNGKHRYSLKLNGKDAYYNTNAHRRGIVIHGADYADDDFLSWNHHLGRSYGCPAVPRLYNEAIVDVLKGGSCFFIYAKDSRYLNRSVWINEEIAAKYYYGTDDTLAVDNSAE